MGSLTQAVDAAERETERAPADPTAWERLGRLRLRALRSRGRRATRSSTRARCADRAGPARPRARRAPARRRRRRGVRAASRRPSSRRTRRPPGRATPTRWPARTAPRSAWPPATARSPSRRPRGPRARATRCWRAAPRELAAEPPPPDGGRRSGPRHGQPEVAEPGETQVAGAAQHQLGARIEVGRDQEPARGPRACRKGRDARDVLEQPRDRAARARVRASAPRRRSRRSPCPGTATSSEAAVGMADLAPDGLDVEPDPAQPLRLVEQPVLELALGQRAAAHRPLGRAAEQAAGARVALRHDRRQAVPDLGRDGWVLPEVDAARRAIPPSRDRPGDARARSADRACGRRDSRSRSRPPARPGGARAGRRRSPPG